LQSKFPSNPESFGNAVGSGWVFSHVFTIPGLYDYQCNPHVNFGMVGSVNVMEVEGDTLTVSFNGMNPHLGQMLTLYVRDFATHKTLDTIVVPEIENADFIVESYVIKRGNKYVIDFYADHNGNGMYDTPPTDHAWRIETGEVMGNMEVDFSHNTNFTDIQSFGPNIMLAEDSELGTILTDALGFTLYYFTKDALPDTSLCTGGCVDNWPLFYVENPELGDGLDMADFGVIDHPEGGMQTTYKGWPLYYWVNDLNPGETKGEAVENVWFVAKPDYSIMLMDGLLIGEDGVTYNSSYEPGEEMVQYFVDEYGRTLYIFINDNYNQNNFTASDFSNNGVWPIYDEELQSVASILDKSLFESIDVYGRSQLAYNGWPLYYFREESLRGDATGVSVPSPGVWPVAVMGLEAPIVNSVDRVTKSAALELYPNPAINELTLVSEVVIESVSIISVAGARIYTLTGIQAREHKITLEGITSGVYMIELRTEDNQLHYGRFVKE
jgi:predicted lipoprotein with Yx(FWY)xxD motif